MSTIWYPLRTFLGDRAVRILAVSIVGVSLLQWLAVIFFIQPQEQLLLLHYSVDFGVDFAGPWHFVYRLPLLALLISVLNGFLAYLLFYIVRVYSYLLMSVGLAVQAIVSVGLTLVILLNI